MTTWKDIAGYEGLYKVSDDGRVRSYDREVGHRWGGTATKRGKELKCRQDKDGYSIVSLCRDGKSKTAKVHRLVAAHFLTGFADEKEVNHKNLVKSDNRVDNLEITDRRGNQQHAANSGVFSGTKNSKRAKKLTAAKAAKLRSIRQSTGLSFKELGRKFGVSAATAYHVCKRDTWT